MIDHMEAAIARFTADGTLAAAKKPAAASAGHNAPGKRSKGLRF
jgi:hypothetical protein